VCDQRRGYGIWVALVQRIRPNPVRESNRGEDNRLVDTTLKHARLFAYTQEEFWELTDCDVVLLYSLEDNVVYTTTGVEAEKRLDNDKVADISMKARHNFGHKDIYHGLDSIVRDYKDAFLGRYVSVMESQQMKPRYGARRSAPSSADSGADSLQVSMATLIVCVMSLWNR